MNKVLEDIKNEKEYYDGLNKALYPDWYKDEQPKQQVFSLIQYSLNNDLPESYDRITFIDKTTLLLNHFIDMAVQGYGWVT